jgi:hypothetical protein
LNRAEWTLVHVANCLVIVTGVVYAVMRYLVTPADEWAVVNHPWQPHMQHLHLLVAPLLVFAVGMIWRRHVVKGFTSGREGRVSGLGLLVGFIPMVVSGYLIQVAVQPGWRTVWIGVHLATSTLWVAAFLIHQLRSFLRNAHEPLDTAAALAEDHRS